MEIKIKLFYFILSKKDNIMDILSRNEKNRIKKFSEGYKNNDNMKYKEIKVRKNKSKNTFKLPVTTLNTLLLSRINNL